VREDMSSTPPSRPTAVPAAGQPRPEPDVGGMEPHPV
jgi:hypothetical protein